MASNTLNKIINKTAHFLIGYLKLVFISSGSAGLSCEDKFLMQNIKTWWFTWGKRNTIYLRWKLVKLTIIFMEIYLIWINI